MEINGLYSYGGEKNRINFGEKTLIVGPNNSGKSSIFKALDFFLRSMTERIDRNSGPWREQGAHEMTVGFALTDSERRYAAEILLLRSTKDVQSPVLAQRNTVEWLACRLENITLTIWLIEDEFSNRSYRLQLLLHLDELGITINAQESNDHAWVAKNPLVPFQPGNDTQNFGNAIEESALQDSLREELVSSLGQRGLAVPDVPNMGLLNRETLTPDEKSRIHSMMGMSENCIPHPDKKCPFFVALGHMLQPKFVFVSEQRRFSDSNNLEKTPLKEDGSNIHSFLFWLKNGDRYRQKAYVTIHDKFKNVHGGKDVSFSVSVTETKNPFGQPISESTGDQTFPEMAVTSFSDTSGQKQGFVDFAHVGAGIKETLFLLSSCFDGQDKVICMDEPAANLHPILIKRLMHEILAPGGQVEPGQIAVITHSPAMASLEMLSSVNRIARVDRHEYSEIVQPSKKDEEWISKYIATFHLLKPDILFSRRVILVEGEADKIFVEAILNLCAEREGGIADYIVVEVGGKSSFKKFQVFLNMFKMNFVILADGDAEGMFESQDAATLTTDLLSQNNDLENKIVYILEENLEHLLACLDQELYDECVRLYEKKPERSYHFIKRLLADNPDVAPTAIRIAHLIGGTNNNGSF